MDGGCGQAVRLTQRSASDLGDGTRVWPCPAVRSVGLRGAPEAAGFGLASAVVAGAFSSFSGPVATGSSRRRWWRHAGRFVQWGASASVAAGFGLASAFGWLPPGWLACGWLPSVVVAGVFGLSTAR
jgi:hypothetical protein